MKVFVSFDYEGMAGIHASDHCREGSIEFERMRGMVADELNAMIDGAFAGGATELLINENHWTMRNISAELLDPRAQYLSGWVKKNLSVAGLDSSYDAVLLVGYHAMAGTPDGVLSHTLLGRHIHNVFVNGKPIGETGMSALLAGHYDVPIALVTGDSQTCAEARDLLGDGPVTVAVKEGIDRFTAKFLSPAQAQALVRAGAEEAVRKAGDNKLAPYDGSSPYTLEIEFTGSSMAAATELMPQWERTGPRSVSISDPEFPNCYNALVAAAMLALHPLVEDKDY